MKTTNPNRVVLPWLLTVCCGVLALVPSVYAQEFQTGQPAPKLELGALWQAPAGTATDWEQLRGKVVVLEFWATWCGPCIQAIPHMNELAGQFKEEPVRFIAITAEQPDTVKAFLDRKPIHGWIGLDAEHATHRAYEVRSIPSTVIVGKDGRIAASIHPNDLSAALLEEILEGKRIEPTTDQAPHLEVKAPPQGKMTNASLLTLSIHAENDPIGSWKVSATEIKAEGVPVESLFAMAYGVSNNRVSSPGQIKGQRGTLYLEVQPPRTDSMRGLNPLLREALELAFNLTAHPEQRDTEVFVLKALEPERLEPTVATSQGSSISWNNGGIEGVNVTVQSLALMLEGRLHTPVLDETGLDDRYDFRLNWDLRDGEDVLPDRDTVRVQPTRSGEEPSAEKGESMRSNPGAILQEVREKLGLELTRTNRQLEWLVIERSEQGSE